MFLPKKAAQTTLFAPENIFFSNKTDFSNTLPFSLRISRCFSTSSIHFLRLMNVAAYNVTVKPFFPRQLKVSANCFSLLPRTAAGAPLPGRIDGGRLEFARLPSVGPSEVETLNNSKGIGCRAINCNYYKI